MATLRTVEEKSAIVARCVELEKEGGDILAYLWSQNYLTPRATWCNLQREWLGRKPYEFTDGKPNEKKRRKKIVNTKQKVLTAEQRAEAARIGIEGGDPKPYLASLGFKNPNSVWHNIKEWYKRNDPKVAAKIPARIGSAVNKELKLEGGQNYQVKVAETPEKPKIDKPLAHSGKKAIGWEGDFGTYIYDRKQGYIDYESNDGEEISMPVDAWREWLKEIREVAQLMGVQL